MILLHTYSGKHKEAMSKRPHSLTLRNIYEKFLKQLRVKENRNNAGKKKKERKKKARKVKIPFLCLISRKTINATMATMGHFPERIP